MKPKNTPHRQAYMRQWNAVKRAARREKGLCPRCGAVPAPGYVTCDGCRSADKPFQEDRRASMTMAEKKAGSARTKSLYQKRRRLGLCGKCGGPPGQRRLKVTGKTIFNSLCEACKTKAYETKQLRSEES